MPWQPEANHQGRLIIHHQFYLFSTPCFIIRPCFIIPDPRLPHLPDPMSRDLPFRTIIHHDFLSIKATAILYYTSVLISTKISTASSLQDPSQTLTKRSYKIEGLRLPVGATHKLKPSVRNDSLGVMAYGLNPRDLCGRIAWLAK